MAGLVLIAGVDRSPRTWTSINARVARATVTPGHGAVQSLMELISHVVVPGIVPIGLVVAIWLAVERRTADVVFWLAALAGTVIAEFVLKRWYIDVALADDPLEIVAGDRFPSGHALLATVAFGALAALLAVRTPRRAIRWALAGGAAAGVAIVSYSRLYVGDHYVSDVAGGVAAGVVWLGLCIAVWLPRTTVEPLVNP
jgi:undecaprenyl-diphosphatase